MIGLRLGRFICYTHICRSSYVAVFGDRIWLNKEIGSHTSRQNRCVHNKANATDVQLTFFVQITGVPLLSYVMPQWKMFFVGCVGLVTALISIIHNCLLFYTFNSSKAFIMSSGPLLYSAKDKRVSWNL
ncbi:hypothetical protein DICVIV_13142 [Dictyocaulus viviparus]|uniref:Uncharacterized protein n=1 Tax=Dictyocaulus viviparus TaxID=29172 RepID=A0A0D8X8J9_DICVI|nr:hypothetical protein DICVIV_13142 [Dictyocaulus viviparus]